MNVCPICDAPASRTYCSRRCAGKARRKTVMATCHPKRSHLARGMCKQCYTRWYADTPGAKEASLRYRKSPKGKRNAIRSRRHPNSKAHKWRNHLKRNYGITPADFNSMKEHQHGQCAICQKKTRLNVDHNHKTGIVRGLLCNRCNRRLAAIDDRDWMVQALAYVETKG